jgi:hypothetical protein
MIQPAALGAELPLLKGLAAPLHLEVVEAFTYATGLAIHAYRLVRPASADGPVLDDFRRARTGYRGDARH